MVSDDQGQYHEQQQAIADLYGMPSESSIQSAPSSSTSLHADSEILINDAAKDDGDDSLLLGQTEGVSEDGEANREDGAVSESLVKIVKQQGKSRPPLTMACRPEIDFRTRM